jgi:hypothetical protein
MEEGPKGKGKEYVPALIERHLLKTATQSFHLHLIDHTVASDHTYFYRKR